MVGRCLGCYRSDGARWPSDGTASAINHQQDDRRTHEGIHRNKFHGLHGRGQRSREHGWNGTYPKISSMRPQRFVHEFAAHHNIRGLDTIARMVVFTLELAGKQLRYRQQIADNGLAL